MNDEDAKKQIAQFRFGIISEFVTGVCLYRGDREKIMQEKVSRKYEIPHSNRTTISRATLKKWIQVYKKSGRKFESLYPQKRKDRGIFRSLDDSLQLEIKNIVGIHPQWNGNAIVRELKHKKILDISEDLNRSVLYRYLKKYRLQTEKKPIDRQAFEASSPNELWQSDILHGPMVYYNGKFKKTYLIAVLDDHSRFIVHSKFYFSEKTCDFKLALKDAIERRGIPLRLYIDNGACYRAMNIDQITAQLGIGIVHTPPYTPQGRGKIERWFRNVRENFLSINIQEMDIEKLNELLENWVDEYHHRIHSSLNETPWEKYSKLKTHRPAPKNLIDYFRLVEFRLVKKDRTFCLNGKQFEAPSGLIDLRIELRYHEETPDDIEIFYEDLSYGMATFLNKKTNFRTRRKSIPSNENLEKTKSGELFKGETL